MRHVRRGCGAVAMVVVWSRVVPGVVDGVTLRCVAVGRCAERWMKTKGNWAGGEGRSVP